MAAVGYEGDLAAVSARARLLVDVPLVPIIGRALVKVVKVALAMEGDQAVAANFEARLGYLVLAALQSTSGC